MQVSRRSCTCAAAVAAALLILAAGAVASEGGTRSVTSHVLIGVTPEAAFGVVADGETIPESPVVADELGIVEFDVDLPAGTHTVSLTPPGMPVMSQVRAEEITTTSAVVRWNTSVPANSRVLYGPTDDYGEDTGVAPALLTSHGMFVSGLTPGTTYHYQAISTDGSGQTVYSGDRTFETEIEPLVVTDVSVSAVGPTWAIIEWNTNRPSTSKVEYGPTAAYGEETPEDDNPVLGHTVTLTGLLDGAEYHFRVLSRDGYGMEAQSSDESFETLELEPTGPPVIGNVDYEAEGMSSVVVTWTTDREATSCVMYGTKGDLDQCTATDTTCVTEHSVRIGPIAPEHVYTFAVLSACGADTAESSESTFVTEVPDGTTLSGKALTIIRPEAVCIAETTATIVWVTDRPCTTWIEYGDDDNWDTPAVPMRRGGECHEVVLSDLAPGTVYYYRVWAWDELGGLVEHEGGSFATCTYPDLTPPETPAHLEAMEIDGVVELVWTGGLEDDLLGYYVYRIESKRPEVPGSVFDVGRATRLNELPLTAPTYVDEHIFESTVYQYAVTAVDDTGNESGPSEGVTVRIEPVEDVEEFSGLSLSIGLNSCYQSTTFEYAAPEGSDVRLRVYSVAGRLVRDLSDSAPSSGAGSIPWDCRDAVNRPVGTGVFVCELAAGDEVVREKLTVIR